MITGKSTEAAQKNTLQAATKACPPNPKHRLDQVSIKPTLDMQTIGSNRVLSTENLTVAETSFFFPSVQLDHAGFSAENGIEKAARCCRKSDRIQYRLQKLPHL